MELLRLQWLWLPPVSPFSSSYPSSPSHLSFRQSPGSHSHPQQAFLVRNRRSPPWLSPSSDEQAEKTKRAVSDSSGNHSHTHHNHNHSHSSYNYNSEISANSMPNYISWYSEFSDGSPRRKVGGCGGDRRYDSLSPEERKLFYSEKRRFTSTVCKGRKMRAKDFPSERRSFSSPFSTVEKVRVDSVPHRFPSPEESSRQYLPPNRSSFKTTYRETDFSLSVFDGRASQEANPFPNRSYRKNPTSPYGGSRKFPSQEIHKTSHKRNSLAPPEEVENIERKRKAELLIPKEELKRLGILSRFNRRALEETNSSTIASFPIYSDRMNPPSPYGGFWEFPSQERSKPSHKRNSLVPCKEVEKMEREGKMAVHREEVEVIEMENNPRSPMLAELLIPKEELKRLCRLSSESRKHWLKIGNTGITNDLVWTIHMMWQTSEVVNVKCHGGPLAQNMKKTQEELERKTGGLVIWMAAGAAAIYRGKDYGRTPVNEHKSSLKRQLEGVISSRNDIDFKREAKNLPNRVAKLQNADRTQRLEKVLMRVGEPEAYFNGDSNLERELKSSITQLPSVGDLHKNYDQEADSTSFKAVHDIEREKEIHGKGVINVHPEGEIYGRNDEKSMPRFNDLVSCGTAKENGNLILLGAKDIISDTCHSNNVDPSDAQNLGVEQQTLHSDFTFDYEAKVQGLLRDLVVPHFEGGKLLKAFPMDGDLLPAITPEYKPPLRRLLYGMDPNLTIDEMLRLRRRAGLLPPHFSVGRNGGHQGLAAAMLSLWEKSEFAKISMKTEAESRSSEIIAEELKRLTGGILLSRDKYCITFYRGKDFIPQAKAEEKSHSETSIPVIRPLDTDIAKDDTETSHDLGAKNLIHIESHRQSKLITKRGRQLQLFRHLQRNQNLAMSKKQKTEKEIEKLERLLNPLGTPPDQESISEEERFMFQKIGMNMKPFLLVGRRGVFAGVIENMHLHWKYRELVKVIVKEREEGKVEAVARMLECESGGILVGIELTSKGHAIIVYRGKNYQRPFRLKSKNLLNKRQALKMSLQSQRCEALAGNISALEEELKLISRSMDIIQAKSGNLSIVQPTADLEEFFENVEPENDSDIEENSLGKEEVNPNAEEEKVDKSSVLKKRAEESVIAKLEAERGPSYRARPLTKKERLRLRKQALQSHSPSHFHVGKSNLFGGLAKAIRLHFQKHALAKIGIKGRALGTSVQELILELERSTGGVLVSNEGTKVILYRGWPDGDMKPSSILEEELPVELIAAMKEEDADWVDTTVLNRETMSNHN